jgi:hypothetical protein
MSAALGAGAVLMILGIAIVALFQTPPGMACHGLNGSTPVCTELPPPPLSADQAVRLLSPFFSIYVLLLAGSVVIVWRRRTALNVLQLFGALAVVLTVMCLQLRTITPLVVATACLATTSVGALVWSAGVARWRPSR